MGSWALVCAILLIWAPALPQGDQHGPGVAERQLLSMLVENGAEIRVEIATSKHGLRSLVAKTDVKLGGVLAAVPAHTAIILGTVGSTAPEMAVALLREKYRKRPRYGEHLAVLPPPGSQLCAESLPPRLIPMLASPELESLVATKQDWLHAVWNGTAKDLRMPLARALPEGVNVTLEELAWATCVVASRTILGPGRTMLLIPYIDMANHEEGSSHMLRFEMGDPANKRLVLMAGRDVKAGEEVAIEYGALRSDEALLHYGFLLHSRGGHMPLAAVDHAHWDPTDQPGKTEYPDYVADTKEHAEEEIARLSKRLHKLKYFEQHAPFLDELCPDSPSPPLRGGGLGLPTEKKSEFAYPCRQAVSMLHGLRALREQALEQEIERLKALAPGLPNEKEHIENKQVEREL